MADTVQITIDDRSLEVPAGQTILRAALDAGIDIPHLCYHEDLPLPHAGCRLCLVEVEGWPRPVTSCSKLVADGMVVHTRSALIDRLVARSFQLIMSTHPVDCKNCSANKSCGLQDISRSRKLKLNSKPLPKILPDYPVDDSHPRLRLDPNLCVLCGQCVYVCNEVEGAHALDFSARGMAMHIGTAYGEPLAESPCTGCLKCVEVCPVGALSAKPESPPTP